MVDWKLAGLVAIFAFCCGILFMLLPTVGAWFRRVLKINGQVAGRTAGRTWNTSAAQPTVTQVLAARQFLKQRGFIIRERRSL